MILGYLENRRSGPKSLSINPYIKMAYARSTINMRPQIKVPSEGLAFGKKNTSDGSTGSSNDPPCQESNIPAHLWISTEKPRLRNGTMKKLASAEELDLPKRIYSFYPSYETITKYPYIHLLTMSIYHYVHSILRAQEGFHMESVKFFHRNGLILSCRLLLTCH
jgi:hypothetical protein